MLWTPPSPCFQSKVTNRTSGFTAPTITLGANHTKGAYAEVFDAALVTFDVYDIYIMISGIGATGAGANRQALIDIGVDNADAGSFTTLIENLVCGNAGAITGTSTNIPPVIYRFPLFIKAGTQIGARGQISDGLDLAGVGIHVSLIGDPNHPELARAGSYVTTFGAVTASSRGTGITPGTSGAEGAYVDLSGADTTVPYWYWEFGIGVADSTMADQSLLVDVGIGDGSNKFLAIQDAHIWTSSDERLSKPGIAPMGFYEGATGVRVYGRASASGTPDSTVTMAAYGVGG